MEMDGSVSRTEDEACLFRTLSSVSGCKVRVVGGWVRDKLLGKQCADVDLVVEGISAEQYAEAICAGGNGVTRAGAIKINEQAGKHVPVTPLHLNGCSFDIVALRSRPGSNAEATLLEDALSRDFTINSLYYDIRDHRVEDPTLRGVLDLNNRLLRTPLPPVETLLHDPLRSLRAVRFASTLRFAIDAELAAVIKSNESVRTQLRTNTARARYFIEMEKMLSYPTARQGLGLMCAMDLMQIVLFPRIGTPPRTPVLEATQCNRGLSVATALIGRDTDIATCGLDRWIVVLSAFLCGYYYTGINVEVPLTKYHLTREWKWNNKHTEAVMEMLQGVQGFADFVTRPHTATRLAVGLLIRKLRTLWRCTFTEAEALSLSFAPAAARDEVKATYQTLMARIEREWQLLDPVSVWDLQPLLRGAELAELFAVKGARVGAFATAVLHFQLEQDAATRTDRAACIEWLTAQQHAIQAPDF